MMMILIGFVVFVMMVDSSKVDIPINMITYNIMRGRYNCYKQTLINDDDFRRLSNVEMISTRADFVRTNLMMISNHLRQYNPDIISFQEIQESPSSMNIRNEISTATFLAQQLDMTFTFSPTLFDHDVQMQYGTAILINHHRFRLLSVEIISLPLGLEPRNAPCLTVQSRYSNVTFRVCSIHFDHNPSDNSVRLQQADTLIRWLTKGKYYPTALLGDFNANRSSTTMNRLYKFFFDDRSSDNLLPTWSDCGEPLKDKIDYVLLDRQSTWTIKQFLHGSKMKKIFANIEIQMLSDHVPLFSQTILSVDDE